MAWWGGNLHAQSVFEASSLTVVDNNSNTSSAYLVGKNKAGQQFWCNDGTNGAYKLYVNGDEKNYLHWSNVVLQHKYGFYFYNERISDGDNHSVTGDNTLQCFLMAGQKHVFYGGYSNSKWTYKSPEADFSLYATANVSAAGPVWVKGEDGYSQMVKWDIQGLTTNAIDHVDIMASYDEGASWNNMQTSTNINDSTTVWLPRKADRVRYRAVVTPKDKFKALVSEESLLTSDPTADFVLTRISIPATANGGFTDGDFTDNDNIALRTRTATVKWNVNDRYSETYGGTKIEYSVLDTDEWTTVADINNTDRTKSSETVMVPAGYDSLQFRVTIKANDTYKLFKDSVLYITATTSYTPAFTNLALVGTLYRYYDEEKGTFAPTLSYTMNNDLYQTRVGQAVVYYSTDEGQTWTQVGTADKPAQEGEVTLNPIPADTSKKYQFRIGLASATNSVITCGIENASMVYAYTEAYLLKDTENFPAEVITDRDVKVTRSLEKGHMSTICLPFDVTEQQMTESFGDEAKVYEYTSMSNNTMYFSKVSSMQAGKPYMVMTAEDKDALRFYSVSIAADAASQSSAVDNDYVVAGIFSPYIMPTNKAEYYLDTDGSLKTPTDASNNTINGYRCYFKLADDQVKLCFEGDDTVITGIESIDTGDNATQPVKVYNLNGQYLGTSTDTLPQGVYIVNGKKTIIK